MNLQKPNYRAWLIDEKDFPHDGTMEEKVGFILKYGILAPSQHNTQPWLFEIDGNTVTIKADYSRRLPVGDPDNHGLFISLGACVENVVQAARTFGFTTRVETGADSVSITFEENSGSVTSEEKTRTRSVITHRHSDKLLYRPGSLSSDIKTILETAATPGIHIKVISNDSFASNEFSKLVDLHLNAASHIASKPAFTSELVRWLRTNGTRDYDGMPGFTVGNSSVKSAIGKKLLNKKPQILQKMVAKDGRLLHSASAIAVFFIDKEGEGPNAYTESGRVIERMWLKLTELGLVAQPLYAAIQDEESQQNIRRILKTEERPVFFMRIGYSNKNVQHATPRAEVGGVMTTAQEKLRRTLKSGPQSHHVQIDKYDIHYVTAGEGKPLVLIHGANIGWPQWHLNLDVLARHYKVYALDLPGAGSSTKVDFHKTDFEKDYADIVDKFIQGLGYEKVFLVGSSFGGWIAMRLAAEGRSYIEKLVLTNPIGFTKHMPMKFRPVSLYPFALFLSKTALKPKRNNKNLEKFMRDVFHDKKLPLKSEFIDYFYELSQDSHNVLFISRLAHYSGMRKELFLGDSLRRIRIPTLVIWGAKDPLMPLATVKDNISLIPNVNVKILEKVGHMPPVEDPETFNKLTIAFLGE